MKYIGCTVVLCLTLLALSATAPAYACTLYSAAGSAVSDGGTLLAKIRDQKPGDHYWYLVTPSKGYAYYGIFTQLNNHGLRGGINEKGLTAVTSTAGTIPKSKRLAAPPYHGGTLKDILTHCGSVADVLAATPTNPWTNPQHIMVADKKEMKQYHTLRPNSFLKIIKQKPPQPITPLQVPSPSLFNRSFKACTIFFLPGTP